MLIVVSAEPKGDVDGESVVLVSARLLGLESDSETDCQRLIPLKKFQTSSWREDLRSEFADDIQVVLGARVAAEVRVARIVDAGDARRSRTLRVAAAAIVLIALAVAVVVLLSCKHGEQPQRAEATAAPRRAVEPMSIERIAVILDDRLTLPDVPMAEFFDECRRRHIDCAIPKALVFAWQPGTDAAGRACQARAAAKAVLDSFTIDEIRKAIREHSSTVGLNENELLEHLKEVYRP